MMKNKSPVPAISTPLRRATLQLLLVSFTILFQELLLIRWLGQQVRVLAYFPNIILISAFLGIGLGCLRSGKKNLWNVWPVSLLIVMAATAWMGSVIFTQESLSEHLWLLYYDLPPGSPVVRNLFLPLVGAFLLSAVSFIPLGQILASRLTECQRLRSALWGYSWDILGSSLGVAAFTFLSFLRCGPPVWFLILGVCAVLLASGRFHRLMAAGVCALGVLGANRLDRADIYSPYYAIGVKPLPSVSMTGILANGSLHQFAMPLRMDDQVTHAYPKSAREGYHIPYRLLARKPRNVLVLGAGTGNDVAVALDEGAESVDVVEIDPVILKLGQWVHPNHPYRSPKVRLFNTDARSFLNTARSTYDLIIFGTLDSMTKLSALSNVRLDNFVYTVESLKAARRHLTPDGAAVLYFMVSKHFIGERLAGMLASAFQEAPWAVRRHYQVFNAILMTGLDFHPRPADVRKVGAERLSPDLRSLVLPRDDWPYLYLVRPGIGPFYLQIAGTIWILAVLGVFSFSERLRRNLRSIRSIDWEMVLFGTAFLLLETRGIIAMNLLWGATWFTNAVVIQSIFLMILLGTWFTALRPLSFKSVFAGLLASLAFVYACPLDSLLSMNPFLKFGVSFVLIGAPVFFASIGFALIFSQRKDAGTAFGWNLLGAVLGGLLELLSMTLGLRNLVLLAMACYLGAAWVHFHEKNYLPRS